MNLTLADLPKIARNYLYVGDGADSSVIAKPLFDTATTLTGNMTYDSGVHAASESSPTDVLLDFGDIPDNEYLSSERFPHPLYGDYGHLYRIDPDHDFPSLRIRLDGHLATPSYIEGRYASVKPRNETYTGAGDGTIGSEGTQAFSIYEVGDFAIDVTLTDVPRGSYFWFHPLVNNTIWDRRMRLDGTWGKDGIEKGLIQLGKGLELDEDGNLTVNLSVFNLFTSGNLLTVNNTWQDLLTNLTATNIVLIYAYRELTEGQTGTLIIQFEDVRTDGMAVLAKGSQEIAVRRNGNKLQAFASPAFDTGTYKARAIILKGA